MRFWPILILLAMCATAAEAETSEPQRCVDAAGHDRCAEEVREIFETFDLPPAESLLGRRETVLRFFMVRGEISPAVTLRLSPNGRGRAEVTPSRSRGPVAGPPLSLGLPPELVTQARSIVRRIGVLTPSGDEFQWPAREGELLVCASHASMGFELIERGAVRRRSPPGCSSDTTFEEAHALAASMLRWISQCRPLAHRFRFSPFDGLDVCARLEGDKEAAAQAWLRTDELRTPGPSAGSVPSQAFFSPEVRLSTSDGVYEGPAAVAAAWRKLDWYWPIAARAESSERVTIKGYLARSATEDLGGGMRRLVAFERAPFTQSWRKAAGAWLLDEMKVEPYAIHERVEDAPTYVEIPFKPEPNTTPAAPQAAPSPKGVG